MMEELSTKRPLESPATLMDQYLKEKLDVEFTLFKEKESFTMHTVSFYQKISGVRNLSNQQCKKIGQNKNQNS